MRRLILLVALITALGALAPAALADDAAFESDENDRTEKVLSATQQWKAAMIADYFSEFFADDESGESGDDTELPTLVDEPEASQSALDTTLVDDVLALRSIVGWGAVFKLMVYAAATGENLEGLSAMDAISDDEGFGFGKLFKDLEFNGEITNLGQLQKAYRTQPDGAPAPDDAEGKTPPGHEKKPDKTPPGHEKKPDKAPPGHTKKSSS